MAKILITGGSGLVGKQVTEKLIKNNHQVVWLSRNENLSGEVKTYKWDYKTNYVDLKAFEGVEHIIHLAGAPIAGARWTEPYKQEIIDSRVKTTELLLKAITELNLNIKSFVGASAIGFYGGILSDKIFTENDKSAEDFLGHSCNLWEKSYEPIIAKGIRTSVIRIGVILAKDGGALNKMKPLFKIGFGSAIASGKQYFPWVHLNDVVDSIIFMLENESGSGTFNCVGSEFITNKEFSEKLAACYGKKILLPNVPKFVLNLAMGPGAVMLYNGVKISNAKLKQSGYVFNFENAAEALRDCCTN